MLLVAVDARFEARRDVRDVALDARLALLAARLGVGESIPQMPVARFECSHALHEHPPCDACAEYRAAEAGQR